MIDEDYNSNCYLKIDNDEFNTRLSNYIATNQNLNIGDILFVCSEYETRQGYGFVIVDKISEPKWHNSE